MKTIKHTRQSVWVVQRYSHMVESFVVLDNARHDDQRNVMADIQAKGHCPFCPENLDLYHKQPIIREKEHWKITPIQWPYRHTKHHFLAISAYHAENIADLREGSFNELQEHLQWLEFTYKISTGGLAMRFGDVTQNGASVKHLHAHVIQPDPERGNDEKVRFKIG